MINVTDLRGEVKHPDVASLAEAFLVVQDADERDEMLVAWDRDIAPHAPDNLHLLVDQKGCAHVFFDDVDRHRQLMQWRAEDRAWLIR